LNGTLRLLICDDFGKLGGERKKLTGSVTDVKHVGLEITAEE
jgi:hypothetical protein